MMVRLSVTAALVLVGLLLPSTVARAAEESPVEAAAKPHLLRLAVQGEDLQRNQCFAEWSEEVDQDQAQKEAEALARNIVGTEGGRIAKVEVKPLDGGASGRDWEVLTYFRGGTPHRGAHFAELLHEEGGSHLVTFEASVVPTAADLERLGEAIKTHTGLEMVEWLEVNNETAPDNAQYRYSASK